MTHTICTLPACDKKLAGRGLCAGHYARWMKHGDAFDKTPLKVYLPAGTPCSVEGCSRTSYSKGLCNPHWQRQHYGSSVPSNQPVAARAPQGQTMQERFNEYSSSAPTSRGCIEWIGPMHYTGYGLIRFYRKRSYFASRAAWELKFGPIPAGFVVRHKCDNPPCVNVDHLEIGTQADNIADMVGRDRHTRGERSGLAKLTDEDVLEIRERAASGETLTSIAQRFAMSSSHIGDIVKGRYWKHL